MGVGQAVALLAAVGSAGKQQDIWRRGFQRLDIVAVEFVGVVLGDFGPRLVGGDFC